MMRRLPGGLVCVLALLALARPAAAGEPVSKALETVAERSGFRATSRSSEVDALVVRLAARSSHVRRFVIGKTVEGREIVAAGVRGGQPCAGGPRPEPVRVLLLGNIHPGECAGKEALLMLLRELSLDPAHRWIGPLEIVFVPNYNADGNERVDKKNRPGQVGPEAGMGIRANAQGFDLNREFVKLESPEARALLRLVGRLRPHVFIDCHTTNGSKHRYGLTYDVAHNPAAPAGPVKMLRRALLPEVTRRLDARGLGTYYYGNFNKDHSVWRTFGHEARYSTEYMGLRGCLAILSEAYAYISYRDRIFATKDFVTACLDYALTHRADVVRIVGAARRGRPAEIPLRAKIAAFDEPATIRGYDLPDRPDAEKDHTVRFLGRFETTHTVTRPWAYAIPESHGRVAEHLALHGIRLFRRATPRTVTAEGYRIDEVKRRERPFQGHRLSRAAVTPERGPRTLPAGTWIVPTDQPLGTLACYLLEPASDDGLLAWNFFDDDLVVGQQYPIVRVLRTR